LALALERALHFYCCCSAALLALLRRCHGCVPIVANLREDWRNCW